MADEASPSCACTALRKASRAVSRVYDEALAGTGITTPQFAILRTLAREGEMPLSRLADAMVMDRTSLYRALAPLERSGYLAIGQAAHGKTKIATLAVGGRAIIAEAAPFWEAAQRRIVGRIGAGGWAALQAALHGITAAAIDAAA